MRKSQSGFAHLAIILSVVVLAAVGATGWYVYNSKHKPAKKSSESQTNRTASNNSAGTNQTSASTAFKLPDGYAWYENSTLGFKFAYPKAWGTPKEAVQDYTKDKSDELEGVQVVASFYEGKILIGATSKDYVPGGADGGCYVYPTFGQNNDPADVSKSYTGALGKLIETKDGGYTSLLKVTRKTATEFSYESYQYYATELDNGLGSCPGLALDFYKTFSSSPKNNGMRMFWYEYGTCCGNLPSAAELAKYKADPNSLLSADTRAQLDKVYESFSTL